MVASEIQFDPAQERALTSLSSLAQRLQQPAEPANNGLLARLRGRAAQKPNVRGLYLWGPVGRGKTLLMDRFYEDLADIPKRRLHFHRFMQQVHADLAKRKAMQDPLADIAQQWADEVRLLCLDEFFVADITDAMLLYRLLEALTEAGVTLVTTSNVPPDELYRDGLQRARFLPAIELLKQHLEVVEIDGGTDYRLRHLDHAPVYQVPADASAHAALLASFEALAPCTGREDVLININERELPVKRLSDGVVWFDFAVLCQSARSAADYVEIAREFHTVLLSDIPLLPLEQDSAARRLITLVDEFYDRRVKLMISAAAPAEQLYQGHKLKFEFERCISRLLEMRSQSYLAEPHLP
ncbi:cell division protein ZapE [Ectothiorhodosinus mongolicus]|uniref:Cell division protein ZapE n=1 Tax=Ectothiorhodosinus mongolicus TaxID=233100 RepID=A0A1R3VMP8_9GAMM|nr:cell division protein ZapE [Ectothiorhodosinus mongolicus]ULX56347.1 cell division protein ZapE [Ectothiorhodosinus mongolicus]SIT65860.1 cell division protein ZapE [Ectothiorhodosinus mongolicus]